MNKQTLFEVAEDSPCHGNGWCFLREYSIYMGLDRTVMQFRLIMDYRYLLGTKLNREVKDEEAAKFWVREGFAKKFAEVYDTNPNISHQELKDKLFNQ